MSNTLMHHGILGQKWGKRNGPPYPLGSSDHSASEKKAGWRKSVNNSVDKTANRRNTKSENSSKTSRYGLSDKQKRAIKIGVAVTATALAAYGTYRLKESGQLDKFVVVGKNKIDDILSKEAGNIEFGNTKISQFEKIKENSQIAFNGLKKLSTPESLTTSLAKANPYAGTTEGKNNCTLCAVAGFLRRTGYDVAAGETGGKQQILGGVIEDCFKGAKVIDGTAVKFGKSPEDAADMLVNKFGQNASGVCSIQWKKGLSGLCGGHAFNWEIKDGKVSFLDFQNNRGHEAVKNYWKIIDPNDALTIARLDNAEVISDAMNKYVKNR